MLFSKVLFLWTRGRSAEADQGGCYSDLWASRWYKTVQCTEGTVSLLWNPACNILYMLRKNFIIYARLVFFLCGWLQGGTSEADHLCLPRISAGTGPATETWKWRCCRQHFLWSVHTLWFTALFLKANFSHSFLLQDFSRSLVVFFTS